MFPEQLPQQRRDERLREGPDAEARVGRHGGGAVVPRDGAVTLEIRRLPALHQRQAQA